MKNNNLHQKPSLIQTISAVLTAGVMWGSGNVIIRSLLLEGLNEIFLVTARVLIIGTLLFSYYIIFNKDKFDKKLQALGAEVERLPENALPKSFTPFFE